MIATQEYWNKITIPSLIRLDLLIRAYIRLYRHNAGHTRTGRAKLPVKPSKSAYREYYHRLRNGVLPKKLYRRSSCNFIAADNAIKTAYDTGVLSVPEKQVKEPELVCKHCQASDMRLRSVPSLNGGQYLLCVDCYEAFYID